MREPLMTVYRMVGVLLVRPMSGLQCASPIRTTHVLYVNGGVA